MVDGSGRLYLEEGNICPQEVERNPTGIWLGGLCPFIRIKLIFAGLLCLRCGQWHFTASFSTQYVILLSTQPPSWLYCVIPNCSRLQFTVTDTAHGMEGKTWRLLLTSPGGTSRSHLSFPLFRTHHTNANGSPGRPGQGLLEGVEVLPACRAME